MPSSITSKQVLLYLNHLGYNNISAQQLKQFMQDLKKLIKHEEKLKFGDDLNHNHSTPLPNKPTETEIQEIFSHLHAQATVASKAKTVDKKQSVIKVQIKRSKSVIMQCPHEHNKENRPEQLQPQQTIENPQKSNMKDVKKKTTKSSTKTQNKMCGKLKPKASFIRPEIHMTMKSDPVALYQYYQSEWKRNKVPGEDNRADLRWAIRERMMGGSRP